MLGVAAVLATLAALIIPAAKARSASAPNTLDLDEAEVAAAV